jgi:hypothetical protein
MILTQRSGEDCGECRSAGKDVERSLHGFGVYLTALLLRIGRGDDVAKKLLELWYVCRSYVQLFLYI